MKQTFVIISQSVGLNEIFYEKLLAIGSKIWIIIFYLVLSVVMISVNISELISANYIKFCPYKSGSVSWNFESF